MNKPAFIELNGQHYNAHSGQLLVSPAVVPPATTSALPPKGGVIDGVIRRSTPLKAAAPPKQIMPDAPKKRLVDRLLNIRGPRRRQHATTLMRTVVAKPVPPALRQLRSVSTEVDQPVAASPPKPVRPTTLDRSQSHHVFDQVKSPYVSHFSKSAVSTPPKLVAHIPVRPAPPRTMPLHPDWPKPTSKPTNSLSLDLDRAVERATSHLEISPQRPSSHRRLGRTLKRKSKLIGAGAMGAALIVLSGFFAVQNVPNVAIRVASVRAGFSARLPAYRPAGFAFSPPKTSAGQVVLNFRSPEENRSFQLIEQPTNWDDAALLGNFVASSGQTYRSLEDSDHTIYLYGSDNATWLSSGIWYVVKGSSSLGNDQLISLANSL